MERKSELAKLLDDYYSVAIKEYSDIEESKLKLLNDFAKENQISMKPADLLKQRMTLVDVKQLYVDYLHTIAASEYTKSKALLKKHGKKILSTSTKELKSFKKNYIKDNSIELLEFYSKLLKYETGIIRYDIDRCGVRTNRKYRKNAFEQEYRINSELEKAIDDYLEDYFYNENDYNESNSMATKRKKILDFYVDFLEEEKKLNKAHVSVCTITLKKFITLLPEVPVLRGVKSKSLMDKIKDLKLKIAIEKGRKVEDNIAIDIMVQEMQKYQKIERRSPKTIFGEISIFKNFVNYLRIKELISQNEQDEIEFFITNFNKTIRERAEMGEFNLESDAEPFKNSMIERIFSKKYNPYAICFKNIERKVKQDIVVNDIDIARFFIPLILYFTGARISEVSFLKKDDVYIEKYDNYNENILKFIFNSSSNNVLKNDYSKRVVYIHKFLANDLKLINVLKKLKDEIDSEYLFPSIVQCYRERKANPVIKNFNKYLMDLFKEDFTKIDEIINARYTMYSFRHLFKTHMKEKNIDVSKIDLIQGHKNKEDKVKNNYIATDSINNYDVVNEFSNHKLIDWKDFTSFINDEILSSTFNVDSKEIE